MRELVAICLRFRFVVLLCAVALVVVGIRAARGARVDVFPEFAPPRVEIQTEAPGLSAIEVETLVTTPIERAVHGVAFVTELRSKSVLGLSSVQLVFADGTDLLHARQLVQERMATVAAQLPLGAKPPIMLSPLSSMSRVLKIGVSSAKLDQMGMTELARFTIRPRLMAVPGVANVAIWGQRDRQLQVRVDPDELRARGVSLDDVVAAAREATTPASAGWVETPTQRIPVTHAPFATTKDALGEALVPRRAAAGGAPNGATTGPGTVVSAAATPAAVATSSGAGAAPIRLADVATIGEGPPPPIGDAIIDGAPGLLLIVEKQPWGNTLDVTRGVEAALHELAPALADVRLDPTIFRPATFIERALANLRSATLLGCALVIGILTLFLHDWRTAIVSVVAIPLSLVAAAAVLAWRGATLDTMTVAGLVIALGEVVDDAIIDVENIERRLALNAAEPMGSRRSPFAVVLAASLEVRSAVVHATAIVILVFLPVYFMDGVSGAFFRPLAVSYVLAVLASLFVALTVTPAMSLILLPTKRGRAGRGPLSRAIHRSYAPWIARVIRRPRMALGAGLAAVGLAAVLTPFLGESFLPEFHETDFLMHWIGRPGTSLTEMDRLTIQVSNELRSIPGIRNFGSHIGRAEVADEIVGPNFAELWVSLDENVDYESSVAKIQHVVDGYPGVQRDVQTYLRERMKEVLTGTSGAIVVRVYGNELSTLRAKAEEVGKALKDVPGVGHLKVEPQVLVPQIEVALDAGALQRFGLTAGEVRRTMATLLQGVRVGEVYRGDHVVDVVVQGRDGLHADVAAVRELRVGASRGADVRLRDLGTVDIVPAPNVVVRDGASRKIDITLDPKGADLGTVARAVQDKVGAMAFPAGYHAEVLGEQSARTAAQQRLVAFAFLALAGIAMILYVEFRSARITAFVMATLPLAVIGGVLAVFFTGRVVSLGSLVGFVTVLGISARNGIMMVSHFRHLETEESMTFGESLVVRGANERVVPILMTALATGAALIPLVVGGSRPGNEIEYPMALVILGGLVTSTLLNLLLVPSLYLRFAAPVSASLSSSKDEGEAHVTSNQHRDDA